MEITAGTKRTQASYGPTETNLSMNSVHLHSHFTSLTKSKKTVKWRKVSRSERKFS